MVLPDEALKRVQELARTIAYGSITIKLNADAKTVTVTSQRDERIQRTDLEKS